jgi:HD-GYP domain-containing protein (c-di-GMP phosphodiesterase class II)
MNNNITPPDGQTISLLLNDTGSLNDRLFNLHQKILSKYSTIDRIACAIYDAKIDEISTFISSSAHGGELKKYSMSLSQSHSLSEIAKTGIPRAIEDIPAALSYENAHSKWVHEQGYISSFTVPMYDNGAFLGFVFFDSVEKLVFDNVLKRDLTVYSSIINLSISSELSQIRTVSATINVTKEFIHLRDFETGSHLERVARYSKIIARAVSEKYHLNDEFIEHVFVFSPLHDVGKIGIPDRILLKPGKLDDAERNIMQTHTTKGLQIIKKIIGEYGLEHLPDSKIMCNIVECHHEFMDGSGYPHGLKGDQVPYEARIVMVADIFDALTSIRPYKKAWSYDDAYLELKKMADNSKLDINCVEALNTHSIEIKEIHDTYQDKFEA